MFFHHLRNLGIKPGLLLSQTSLYAFLVLIKEPSEIIQLLFRLGIKISNLILNFSIFFIELPF